MTEEKVEIKIAKIEANQENLVQIINKLDATLSKITEVSTNIAQMLAVHDNRLNVQEQNQIKLADTTRSDFSRIDNQIEEVYRKISTVKNDLHNEIHTGFNKLERNFKDLQDDNIERAKDVNDRFTKLERFVWLIAGGGTAIGFILSKGIPALIAYFSMH